jgi:Ca2+-binding EF-hand superfamily protein
MLVAFAMYDEDSDGYVTVDEMRDCLTNMYKAHGEDINSVEVSENLWLWLIEIDSNSD